MAAARARADAEKWWIKAVGYAIANRADIFLETAMATEANFEEMARLGRDNGYRVRVVHIARPNAMSRLDVVERAIRRAGAPGRVTSHQLASYDDSYRGVMRGADAVDAGGLADEVIVHGFGTQKPLHSNTVDEDGVWIQQPPRAAAVIATERGRLWSRKEYDEFTAQLDALARTAGDAWKDELEKIRQLAVPHQPPAGPAPAAAAVSDLDVDQLRRLVDADIPQPPSMLLAERALRDAARALQETSTVMDPKREADRAAAYTHRATLLTQASQHLATFDRTRLASLSVIDQHRRNAEAARAELDKRHQPVPPTPVPSTPRPDAALLDRAQHQQVFTDTIRPTLAPPATAEEPTERTERTEKPVAYFVIGQTGTDLEDQVSTIEDHLAESRRAYVTIGDYSRHHPNYGQVLKKDPATALSRLSPDTITWRNMAMSYAAQRRYDFVVESAMRPREQLPRVFQRLRQLGYRVEVHLLAVRAVESMYEILYRQTVEGPAVPFSDQADHNRTYADVLRGAYEIDRGDLVDHTFVHGHEMEQLYENKRDDTGEWVEPAAAFDALVRGRARRLDDAEYLRFELDMQELRDRRLFVPASIRGAWEGLWQDTMARVAAAASTRDTAGLIGLTEDQLNEFVATDTPVAGWKPPDIEVQLQSLQDTRRALLDVAGRLGAFPELARSYRELAGLLTEAETSLGPATRDQHSWESYTVQQRQLADAARRELEYRRRWQQRAQRVTDRIDQVRHLATDRTHKTPTGEWTPQRAALHEEIVNDYYAQHAAGVPADHHAILLAGMPGAGKTTLLGVHPHIDVKKYLVINVDLMKELLIANGLHPHLPADPGFEPIRDGQELAPMELNPLIHEESRHLSHLLAERALADGRNVIWDFVMGKPAGSGRLVDLLRHHGYRSPHGRLTGILVDVAVDTARRRAADRYRIESIQYRQGRGHGGRSLPARLFDAYELPNGQTASRQNFDALKDQFDDWEIYDNSRDRHQLVDRSQGQLPVAGLASWLPPRPAFQHRSGDIASLILFAKREVSTPAGRTAADRVGQYESLLAEARRVADPARGGWAQRVSQSRRAYLSRRTGIGRPAAHEGGPDEFYLMLQGTFPTELQAGFVGQVPIGQMPTVEQIRDRLADWLELLP